MDFETEGSMLCKLKKFFKRTRKMPKSSEDKVILSYGDSIIRESDMNILEGPHWLNDRIITFYFEYLYEKEFQNSSKLAFISPEVSQFLKFASSQDLVIFLEPLNLTEKELVVMAVNNSQDLERPGGSHWSLLMFSLQARSFYHFDSSSGMNFDAANQLASMLHSYMTKNSLEKFDLKVIEVHQTLQQKNGYDCGVHVLCNALHATRYVFVHGHCDTLEKLSEDVVKSKRNEMIDLIKNMKT